MSWLTKIKNWLKISSVTLRFTPEIENYINEAAKIVTAYYLKRETESLGLNEWIFFDPYRKIKRKINLVIRPEKEDKSSGYSKEKQTIYIFPYYIQEQVSDSKFLFNYFHKAIEHEFSHVLNPNPQQEQSSPADPYIYYSSPAEFDAYSKEMVTELRNYIKDNPQARLIIEDWLRSDNILSIDVNTPLFEYSEALYYWTESDSKKNTNYIRKLKQRIYNEV